MKSFKESLGLDNQSPTGIGLEKKVYEHPDCPDKVIAVNRLEKDTETAKRGFYLRKVLHFLFPDNIPDVHLESPQISILEKRHRDAGHIAIGEYWRRRLAGEKVKERSKETKKAAEQRERDPQILELVKSLSALNVGLDCGGTNFSYSPEGFAQYLDSIYEDGDVDIKSIRVAIEARSHEKGYDQALKYLERYKNLIKGEKGPD